MEQLIKIMSVNNLCALLKTDLILDKGGQSNNHDSCQM